MHNQREIRQKFLFSVVLAMCTGMYLYGLFGGFLFDDYPNIVRNQEVTHVGADLNSWKQAALSSEAGILKRPVSMLSFAANHYFFGLNPAAFKIANLLIHLACGILVFFLARRLIPYLCRSLNDSGCAVLALVIAAFWLLHPLAVSTVLYVVQRMTLLSTFFMLAGLSCYVHGRLRSLHNQTGVFAALAGLTLFGGLAILSKENGALIVLYALAIEAVCFRFQTQTQQHRAYLVAFFVISVFVPGLLAVTFLAIHPEWLQARYAIRDFTLTERLLTQARIIFHYLQWILLPLPSSLGIYHDNLPTSSGLFSPLSTIAALAGLSLLAAVAWLARRAAPYVTFGIVWFFLGHVMESTVIPLEMAYEHRNYLPMFGIIVATVLSAHALIKNLNSNVKILLVAGLLLTLGSLTAIRAYTWGDPIRLALATVEHHPNSSRSLLDAGRALIIQRQVTDDYEQPPLRARQYFLRASKLNPSSVFPAASLVLSYSRDDLVPNSAVDRLVTSISTQNRFFGAPVLDLVRATAEGHVPLDRNQLTRIIDVAMTHERASPTDQAMILSQLGRYHYNRLDDAQAAISLTMTAIEIQPAHPVLRMNLVNLALALGRDDIAREAFSAAEALDKQGLYREELAQLKSRL